MRRQPTSILISAAVLCLYLHTTSAAQAGEIIYKSIAPDGGIFYSWQPEPDASRVEAIEVNSLTSEQRRAMKQLRREGAIAGRTADAEAAGLEDQWTRVDADIKQAQAELQSAEAALQAGRTPLPGERRGNVGGGSRLTQAYFDRLHDLELGVERAKQELQNAYGARNALK